MRPVKRDDEPKKFKKYDDAKPYLVKNFGLYCSYCERGIPTLLAVEHIQPKGLKKYEHLLLEWTNFLLGCPNCNGAKTDKDVELDKIFLPDRDNTFVPFTYDEDGKVSPSTGLSPEQKQIAESTIELCALNKYFHPNWDEKALQGALERWGQRHAAWITAKESLKNYQAAPSEPHAKTVGLCASGHGFFSIWMKTFEAHPEVRKEIIAAFPGTAQACFDAVTTQPVTPRPDDHKLPNGGKI
jgi:uncharacterized protein (TIGR02646 family)